MTHTAKECRNNIEVITSGTAQCKICGQTYKRSKNYGKSGWQKKEDDNSLIEYIRIQKEVRECVHFAEVKESNWVS